MHTPPTQAVQQPTKRKRSSTAKADDKWWSVSRTAEYLGVSFKTLVQLGDDRRLTRRKIPGSTTKFLGADVIRLAELSTTAAIGLDGDDQGDNPAV